LDIGIARSQPGDLRGGDPEFNAGAVHDLLRGKTGPIRDAALLNAAAALTALDGPAPETLTAQLQANYARAAQAVDSGTAATTLDRWIEISQTTK
ncbi:MAG TPA: anthranilate phosphoribosyltransferase, partial [Trebonia sp.]